MTRLLSYRMNKKGCIAQFLSEPTHLWFKEFKSKKDLKKILDKKTIALIDWKPDCKWKDLTKKGSATATILKAAFKLENW